MVGANSSSTRLISTVVMKKLALLSATARICFACLEFICLWPARYRLGLLDWDDSSSLFLTSCLLLLVRVDNQAHIQPQSSALDHSFRSHFLKLYIYTFIHACIHTYCTFFLWNPFLTKVLKMNSVLNPPVAHRALKIQGRAFPLISV